MPAVHTKVRRELRCFSAAKLGDCFQAVKASLSRPFLRPPAKDNSIEGRFALGTL